MAGRAGMGGPREVALACLVVGRLVVEASAHESILTEEQRRSRAQNARHWLGAAAIPAAFRAPLVRLAEASGEGDREALRRALDAVIAITANQLEAGARLDLVRLAQTVAV